jgi:hypothetical protein
MAGYYAEVPIPPGVGRMNETEIMLFQEYTRAREPTEWLAHEVRALVMLARVDAMAHRAVLETPGDDPRAIRGLLTLIRATGAMKTRLGMGMDPGGRNLSNTLSQQRAQQQAQTLAQDTDDLLAEPSAE